MALPEGRQTFDRLMAESLPAALRFALRLTGHGDLADEVVQEAMLRAARSWKTYRGESRFETWLFRIVVNVFRDRAVQATMTESLDERQIEAAQVSPSEQMIADELGEIVARCVSTLPPRQREVLVLAAYEGLAAGEIASVLETTEANVYSTLSLARARLRRQLGPYLAEK
ncbi:MAG: RNA polymerase sigma factor [Pirellulales bacterium]|nr:RNA polymerase sigma factor [Pirellulales bacterium]